MADRGGGKVRTGACTRYVVATRFSGSDHLKLDAYISCRMSNRLTDLSTLERLFKGDRTLVADYLRLYLEEAPAHFKQMAQLLEAGDAKGLASVAHELRPQAHYLGAPRLLEALVALGERAHSGNVASCSELVSELLALGRTVDAEVRAVLATY